MATLSHSRSLISVKLPAWICWTSLAGIGLADIKRPKPPDSAGGGQHNEVGFSDVTGGCQVRQEGWVGIGRGSIDDIVVVVSLPLTETRVSWAELVSWTDAMDAGGGRDPKGRPPEYRGKERWDPPIINYSTSPHDAPPKLVSTATRIMPLYVPTVPSSVLHVPTCNAHPPMRAYSRTQRTC